MNSACSQLQDDWELYALGSLPDEVQKSMSSHLESGCTECQRRYYDAQMALTAMSHLAPRQRPSANVERRLMQSITAAPAPSLSAWSFWKLVPWAAAFACLVMALWLVHDRKRLQAELAESARNSQLAEQNQKALRDELESKLEAAQQSLKDNSTTAVVSRSATPASPTGDEAKNESQLRSQLAQALQQAKLAEADKAAMQRQFEQLQAELTAATNRSASLENELRLAQQPSKPIEDKDKKQARANSDQNAILAAELAKSQAEVRRLSMAANNGDRIERLLKSASLQQISLRSVIPQAGHATARALYSPQGGLLLVANSLPKLPEQKCYQLWLIRKGSPAILSGGLITLQDDGEGILFAPPSDTLAQLTALAITDEPAGGSVSSRGRKLLFGAQ